MAKVRLVLEGDRQAEVSFGEETGREVSPGEAGGASGGKVAIVCNLPAGQAAGLCCMCSKARASSKKQRQRMDGVKLRMRAMLPWGGEGEGLVFSNKVPRAVCPGAKKTFARRD